MPVKPGPPPERIFAPTTAWQPRASSRVSETLVAWPVKTVEPAGNSWVRLIGAGLAAEVCTVTVTATPSTLQPVNAMLVRAPMPVPLRPRPDLKLPATASPEHRVTWLDTASRMPTDESAARVPDQAPPGETVNVVAASAGTARSAAAAAARANAGAASRPVLCFMIPPRGSETGVHPRPTVGDEPATRLTRRCNGTGQPDGWLPGRRERRRDPPRLAQAAFDRAVDEAAPQARVVARGEVDHARRLLQPGQVTGQLAGPVCHPGGP